MTPEKGILAAVWLLSIVVFICLVPPNRIKEACILFLSAHIMTWPVGLVLVELQSVAHPVREFSLATRSNFTFNYLFYPMVSMLANLNYPAGASRWKRVAYQIGAAGGLSGLMQLIQWQTMLIEHVKFNWLFHFLILLAVMVVTRAYGAWFFRGLRRRTGGSGG